MWKSVNSQKNALITRSALRLSKRIIHMTIDNSVCDIKVGGSLLQQQADGTSKPVRYWYLSLIDTERKEKRHNANALLLNEQYACFAYT